MEPFEMQATAGGGSCLLRGEQLISIDAGAPLRDRAMSLARALSEIERQTVSMVPEARDVVKAMKGSRPKRGPEELAIISTRAAFRRRHSVPRLDEGAEDHRYERLPRPRDNGLKLDGFKQEAPRYIRREEGNPIRFTGIGHKVCRGKVADKREQRRNSTRIPRPHEVDLHYQFARRQCIVARGVGAICA